MKLLLLLAARMRDEFNKIYNGTKAVYNSVRLGGKTLAVIESERNAAITTATNTAIQTNVTDKLGVASGIATLDTNGQVPTAQLPASVLGGLSYKGTWDASTGSYPTTPANGYYYVISVAGTISGKVYEIGDWAVYNGTTWDKVDSSDQVASVFGRSGAVVLLESDVTGVIGTYAEFLLEFETGLLG